MDLRDKLDELKKKAERNCIQGVAQQAGEDLFRFPGRDDPEGTPAGNGADFAPSTPSDDGPLERFVRGEATRCAGGFFYRVFEEADRIWAEAPKIYGEYLETLSAPLRPGMKACDVLSALQKVEPEGICYLDIETTGLSNTPLFLIGLMYTASGKLVVDQLFARDYTEERVVLEFLSDAIRRFPVLVTFNGERFDIPFIEERMAVERIDFSCPGIHLDLLPVARRLLGRRTPNHKLQTLEVFLLGRKRIGDIPGSRIPGVYHEFVRTANAGRMAAVIHHNRLDLLSMLELVTLFVSRGDEEPAT